MSARDSVSANKLLRDENDFYETPPLAVFLLLEREQFQNSDGSPALIWEPACGRGAISEVFINRGHEVYSTDLIDRGYGDGGIDFLSVTENVPDNLMIVTNPPYTCAQKFVEKSLNLGAAKVAMLLRLSFLESGKRKKFFEETPLKAVYVFSNRISPARGGLSEGNDGTGGMVAYAWYVWERGHSGPPSLGWLSYK